MGQVENMHGGGDRFLAMRSLDDLISTMEAAGEGARGIVAAYPARGKGHFFNVENQGGKIPVVFIDRQSTNLLHPRNYTRYYLMRTN